MTINDVTPPAWKAAHNLANATRPRSGALEDIAPLCIWPPNLQYHCWLDVLSSRNDEVGLGFYHLAVAAVVHPVQDRQHSCRGAWPVMLVPMLRGCRDDLPAACSVWM